MNNEKIKLAKIIADRGFCSRREAEKLILQNRVQVELKSENNVAARFDPMVKISIDGENLNNKKPNSKLYILHKPSGYITSTNDDRGRKIIYDLIPNVLGKLMPVGRLDFNTEGLLLLTNNGELKRQMELPKNNYKRVYKIRAHGKIFENKLAKIAKGCVIDGIKYRPFKYKIEKTGTNNWLIIEITEGKNREIRKLMEHIDLQVNRLIRIKYHKYSLDDLPKGEIKEVSVDV